MGRRSHPARGMACAVLGMLCAWGTPGAANAAPVAAIATGAGAGGTSAWMVQPSADSVASSGHLVAVSCLAPGSCEAVGSRVTPSGAVAVLAEGLSGATWEPQPAAPLDHQGSWLSGVSCTSAAGCTAVGYSLDGTGADRVLAERLVAGRWVVDSLSGLGTLASVSCAASTCVAVGSASGAPLVERRDGAAWTAEAVPSLPGATSSSMASVSCPDPSHCLAVGTATLASGAIYEVAWVSVAATWRVEAVPAAASGIPGGVSCSAVSTCVAVGYRSVDSQDEAYAAGWDGSTWTPEAVPYPARTQGDLTGVSCSSPTACTASGTVRSDGGPMGTVMERWDGRAWSEQPDADPSYVYADAVACPTDAACVAVGSSTNVSDRPTGEAWDGTSWSAAAIPSYLGAIDTMLTSVSCTAPQACTAVGSTIERWDGSAWTLQAGPAPGIYDPLSAVSCTTPTACVAVGPSASVTPSAVGWDGTRWTSLAVAPVPGVTSATFTGVSCSAPTACTAVGWDEQVQPPAFQALIERWDGATWSLQPSPQNPAGSWLAAVSCPTATFCIAVGRADTRSASLVERWDGRTWTTVTTPSYAELDGVSCPASDACTAVGNTVGTPVLADALRWDGSSWNLEPLPEPPGARPQLGGVSCATATTCTAVGESGGNALVEVLDPSGWRIQAVPDRYPLSQRADANVLDGVSCSSPGTCVAAGTGFQPASGLRVSLIEAALAPPRTPARPGD